MAGPELEACGAAEVGERRFIAMLLFYILLKTGSGACKKTDVLLGCEKSALAAAPVPVEP